MVPIPHGCQSQSASAPRARGDAPIPRRCGLCRAPASRVRGWFRPLRLCQPRRLLSRRAWAWPRHCIAPGTGICCLRGWGFDLSPVHPCRASAPAPPRSQSQASSCGHRRSLPQTDPSIYVPGRLTCACTEIVIAGSRIYAATLTQSRHPALTHSGRSMRHRFGPAAPRPDDIHKSRRSGVTCHRTHRRDGHHLPLCALSIDTQYRGPPLSVFAPRSGARRVSLRAPPSHTMMAHVETS